jgi:hypothetical protein
MQPSSGPHPQPSTPSLLLLQLLSALLPSAVQLLLLLLSLLVVVQMERTPDAASEADAVAAAAPECFMTNSFVVSGSSKGDSSLPKWCRTRARTAWWNALRCVLLAAK